MASFPISRRLQWSRQTTYPVSIIAIIACNFLLIIRPFHLILHRVSALARYRTFLPNQASIAYPARSSISSTRSGSRILQLKVRVIWPCKPWSRYSLIRVPLTSFILFLRPFHSVVIINLCLLCTNASVDTLANLHTDFPTPRFSFVHPRTRTGDQERTVAIHPALPTERVHRGGAAGQGHGPAREHRAAVHAHPHARGREDRAG